MKSSKLRQYAFQDIMRVVVANDSTHFNNPENQLTTLSMIVDKLLKDNESGKNEDLIAFYVNIGRSIKSLIKYQKQENNSKL